ncbi:autotransporter outer membrane beta-barrel domain-containing protein [Mailhella sp.]|uniref:autotransporter outer membrane beta-barrel domain-containing protein n=1 Tax=Mailhella sp. TaxID=1981029 RepID=UPI004064AAB5
MDTLKGDGGNINMVDADKLGSFTASNVESEKPEFKVQAIDEAGNVKNADGVSAATLAAMMANVDVVDATVTASADKGIVNNGFTITTDDEGNPVVTGGGVTSVTEAVLESASINTVALTHILTNDVRKRLGDIRADQNKTGVWMRWDGGKLKGDSGLTNNFNTIQIGGDTKAAKNCRIGFAGSFTHGDGDFNRGSSELEGFSFALYGTWMAENGMFADVVARLGNFSTEMKVEGLEGDMDNRVASLSGEYGWRINLAQQFFVEPQVELAYTYVSSDDLTLGDARFAFDSVDSLTGRAGVLFGWNLPEERGNVYARASVLQQFMGDAKVTGYSGVAPTVHEIDGEDTWLEYGIGANVKLTDSTYLWADVERTEGADIEEEWRGTVGVRFSF